jgi:hypothetical protein
VVAVVVEMLLRVRVAQVVVVLVRRALELTQLLERRTQVAVVEQLVVAQFQPLVVEAVQALLFLDTQRHKGINKWHKITFS